ncbi:MAG: GTP-binding protein [Verrucomicrobiales bacterium]|jgi:G3E family GTPase|nr:GTP-binding protein [Verrucomicrobiales bacterium]
MRILPVYLVTGFLGSGKSTLLEHIITGEGFPKEQMALIINDAGPLNVDAKLFRGKAARIAALTGGCACCATPLELIFQLKQYAADTGLAQVWVEASGLANTEDLLDCLTSRDLAGKIEIRQIIYVLDAKNFPRWLVNRWVHEAQARWADVIIINKTDQVSAADVANIRTQVGDWNAGARLLESEFGRVRLPDSDCGAGAARDWPALTLTGNGEHVSMKAFFVPLPRPVAREDLERILRELPAGVCRVKGFLRFRSAPDEWQLVHQVGNGELHAWRYEREVEHAGLVVIGLALDLQLARHALRQLGA